MRNVRPVRNGTFVVVAATILLGGICLATPIEPNPEQDYRPLRPGWVRTWYIYNDAKTDGILNPGDQLIARIDNWWTPVSAHTQHNYSMGPYGPDGFTYDPNEDDMSSSPLNFAHKGDPPGESYWLPTVENAVQFYMTYSQLDNHDWETNPLGLKGLVKDVIVNRNKERQGWAFSWTIHKMGKEPNGTHLNDQTPAGNVNMDVFVHDGQGTFNVPNWGTSVSNPQVALSDDIHALALDNTAGPGTGTQFHPPQFDDDANVMDYTPAENQAWLTANGLDANDLTTIVNSMELREHDPYGATVNGQSIYLNRTPQQVQGLGDHNGNPYVYADAFHGRYTYRQDTTDGGVLAGFSGYTEYDPNVNNWGDQQVIRIDFDADTFLQEDPAYGNITQVLFWDFGYAPGATQINPTAVILDLANTILFPEHRFYIAQVEMIPEPATLCLIALGAGLMLVRRRRSRIR